MFLSQCLDHTGHWTQVYVFMSLFSLESSQEGTIRYGEADNPGPHLGNVLTVGVSNPGGLRQKEDVLLDLGPGIWSLAETQLSVNTFKTCAGTLRNKGRAMNREVRLLGGSPAPLRQNSTWASSWTGVSVLSDVPAAALDVPWPMDTETVNVSMDTETVNVSYSHAIDRISFPSPSVCPGSYLAACQTIA